MPDPIPASSSHRLAEQRSLAYHRRIAERLRDDPALLDAVRRRLRGRLQQPRSAGERYWAQAWLEIFHLPLEQLLAFLVERSERADQFRQSTPFAGILKPAERWAIHRQVKKQWLQRTVHDQIPA